MRLSKNLRRSVLYALFGALMFLSDLLMEPLPNVHLVGVLLALFTRVYRAGALVPLYVYVGLTGLFYGFSTWWIPYLYVWLPLWGAMMLLPGKLRGEWIVLPLFCAAHGLLFGALYAPAQALLFGYDLRQTLAWIASGVYFDLLHGIGNFALAFLIRPLSGILFRLEEKYN